MIGITLVTVEEELAELVVGMGEPMLELENRLVELKIERLDGPLLVQEMAMLVVGQGDTLLGQEMAMLEVGQGDTLLGQEMAMLVLGLGDTLLG